GGLRCEGVGGPGLRAGAAAGAAPASVVGEDVEHEAATVEEDATVVRGVGHKSGPAGAGVRSRYEGEEHDDCGDDDERAHGVQSCELPRRYACRGMASGPGTGLTGEQRVERPGGAHYPARPDWVSR